MIDLIDYYKSLLFSLAMTGLVCIQVFITIILFNELNEIIITLLNIGLVFFIELPIIMWVLER